MHPAFLFGGRIILNHTALEDIGFKVHAIGEGRGPSRSCVHSRTQHDMTLLQLSMLSAAGVLESLGFLASQLQAKQEAGLQFEQPHHTSGVDVPANGQIH